VINLLRSRKATLAALADGSLTGAARERALRSIRSSPELKDALAEQIRAVELVGSLTERAPASLREDVHAMIAREHSRGAAAYHLDGAPRRRRARWGVRVAATGALAAVAAALLITLSIGLRHHRPPTFREALAQTQLPASASAPTESSTRSDQLTAAVDSVTFPYWDQHFRWRATGSRAGKIRGREVTTVYYADRRSTRTAAYAIVSGAPLPVSGGSSEVRGDVTYRVLDVEGSAVVTWLRSGHTCVLSGSPGVTSATLLRLASWA
jgi:hypothetical protein